RIPNSEILWEPVREMENFHHGGRGGQEEKSCLTSGFNLRVLSVLRGRFLASNARLLRQGEITRRELNAAVGRPHGDGAGHCGNGAGGDSHRAAKLSRACRLSGHAAGGDRNGVVERGARERT